jgi:hypothetical protein
VLQFWVLQHAARLLPRGVDHHHFGELKQFVHWKLGHGH